MGSWTFAQACKHSKNGQFLTDLSFLGTCQCQWFHTLSRKRRTVLGPLWERSLWKERICDLPLLCKNSREAIVAIWFTTCICFKDMRIFPLHLFKYTWPHHPVTKVEFIHCSLSSLNSHFPSGESLERKLVAWSVSLNCLYDWDHLLFVLLPLSCITYENSQEIHLYHKWRAFLFSYRCDSLWQFLYSTIWIWVSQWSQILSMFTVLPWTWVCIYLPEIKSSYSLDRSLGI